MAVNINNPTDEQVKFVGEKIDVLNSQLAIGVPVADCSIAWNAHCIQVYMLFQKQLLPNPLLIARMSQEEQKHYRAAWDNVLAAQLFFTPFHFKTVYLKMKQILDTYEGKYGEISDVVPEDLH